MGRAGFFKWGKWWGMLSQVVNKIRGEKVYRPFFRFIVQHNFFLPFYKYIVH